MLRSQSTEPVSYCLIPRVSKEFDMKFLQIISEMIFKEF